MLEGQEDEDEEHEIAVESRRIRSADHSQGQSSDKGDASASNQLGGLKNMLVVKKFSREAPKPSVGSVLSAVKDGSQMLGVTKPLERRGSYEKTTAIAPSKQLQTPIDIAKSDSDSKGKEVSSPKSCGHVYSFDNKKNALEKDRPKSQFMVGSQ